MLLVHLILGLFGICCVVPLIMVISISFSSESAILSTGYRLLPVGLTASAYSHIFDRADQLIAAYRNSIIVTAVGTALGTAIMAGASYALSRKEFRGSLVFTFLFMFPLLFSGGLVPTYILMVRYLGLLDSYWALILPFLVNPWHVFLLRAYMQSIPQDVVESARIDGAYEAQIFTRIIVPMTSAGIAAVALLLSLLYWNDWYNALLYINDAALAPLQFWMMRVMTNIRFLLDVDTLVGGDVMMVEDLPNETARMAMVVLAAGPMLIVYPFFQRYFTKGIRVGSIKG